MGKCKVYSCDRCPNTCLVTVAKKKDMRTPNEWTLFDNGTLMCSACYNQWLRVKKEHASMMKKMRS